MVSSKFIYASNALLTNGQTPYVAVFIGATSGVGRATIKALVTTGARSRIYLLGRKTSKDNMSAFIHELHAINPKAQVIWVEAEISLLAEAKRVCKDIVTKEARLELLFMSAGYAPFGDRNETIEGLEVTQSLELYSRVLFMQLLLPLLSRSDAGRVMSVLAGGLEPATITLDDLDLKQPANFGGFKAQGHYAAMGTLAMEELAKSYPSVTFVHSFPGWVMTGNHRRGAKPGSVLARIVWPVSEPLVWLMSLGEEESGQRHLFASTSAMFGGSGISWKAQQGMNSTGEHVNGVFLVNQKCDCTLNAKAMSQLRREASEAVWAHLQKVVQIYL